MIDLQNDSQEEPQPHLPWPACGPQGRLVVVFGEQAGLAKLRWLKPGFRHCWAYLPGDAGWTALEAMSHRVDIKHFYGWNPAADLAAHLRRQGWCALTVPRLDPPRRLAPPLPFSCVELVKRLIGLHSWSIRTPWELFLETRKISLDYGFVSFYISNQQEQGANMGASPRRR